MTTINLIKLFFATVLVFGAGAVSAQSDDQASDQADVWAQVELQWNLVEKKDSKWIDRLLTDDFSGWSSDTPAPRGKASTKMWDRFSDDQGKMVAHELYPLAIIVNDGVAIAHYLYTSAYEDKDGEVEVNNGRYTDVLVQTSEGWKFLAWHGGDDE